MSGLSEIAVAVLVVAATAVLTLAVIGLIRIPNTYVKVHATSKAVALGPLLILLATLPGGDLGMILRAVLVGGFMLVTTPVAAQAITRLERLRSERHRQPSRDSDETRPDRQRTAAPDQE